MADSRKSYRNSHPEVSRSEESVESKTPVDQAAAATSWQNEEHKVGGWAGSAWLNEVSERERVRPGFHILCCSDSWTRSS